MPESRYWLFKSEPQSYSFADLMNEEGRTAEWDGVRNYQARNFMRDDMKIGDRALFYHSSSGGMQVVGTATVVREGYPDFTGMDPKDDHYDPKATPDNPIWYMVDIRGEQELARPVPLSEIKNNPLLQNMVLVKRSRLSVQPMTKEEFEEIVSIGGAPEPA